MNIKIRKARPEDVKDLTELSIRSKRSNGYDEAFMAACREELTVTEDHLADGEYWVAESGVVCGCAIDPDWQRQGIGRLLWKKLLERAKERRLERLHLDADPAAAPFYGALGFEVAGESPSGSIAGRTLPHMTLVLDRAD
jgi:ribosomal protein S18 acetylase RimI-like enzyme